LIGVYANYRLRKVGVQLSISNIHGVGVFAARKFKSDTIISFVAGEWVHKEDTIGSVHISFFRTGKKYSGLCYDLSSKNNFVRYINSNSRTGQKPNCEVVWKGPIPFLKTICVINAGDEILLKYRVRNC
jgi:hypothetical protein